MDDDPDSDKTKQTTKDKGLLILLREEWHPYLLPRFNEIARVTSRCREFALQLLNLHFQNQQHQFPTEKLQSFLFQTMGLFCRNSWIQASMLIFIAHRCRSEDGGYKPGDTDIHHRLFAANGRFICTRKFYIY
jgi:hypothetical protein